MNENRELKFLEIETRPLGTNLRHINIRINRDNLKAIFHDSEGKCGVIWISGRLGGFDGPSFGIFTILSYKMVSDDISSLRLDYRVPGDFNECVSDVLVGIDFLQQNGVDRIALVGHSFGGAVAIMAGTMSPIVKTVVGLSSQTYGAHRVKELAPKPLLLIHGARDRNLSAECSKQIFQWADEPRELKILKGCGHFLRECHQEIHDLLREWITKKL